jgi:type I restriction-modification system DNA methylase subunit
MKSIFLAMGSVSDFYGEYGIVILGILILLYFTDNYISKYEIVEGEGKRSRYYSNGKIALVIVIGLDCLFDFGIKDNITYFLFFAYTIYILRRLFLIKKLKNAEDL